MARRVAHFNDPKLEAQFDEIVRSEGDVKQEVEERIDEVGEQLNQIYDPADTTPPTAPTGFKAIVTFRAFLLEWNPNEEGDFDHYVLEWSTTADDGQTWTEWYRIANIGKAVNYPHNGLNPHLGYRYRLYAVDSAKNISAPSVVYLAGHPGKISLSEDIVGELVGQYVQEGAISLQKWSADLQASKQEWDTAKVQVVEQAGQIAIQAEAIAGNTNFRTQFTVSPDQINQTVAEVYPDGTGSASAIDQTNEQVAIIATDVDKSKADIAVLAVKSDEISGTVAQIQANEQQTQTTIQQLSDSINMRLAVVDSNGIPIPLAQIAVSRVGEDGYIVLDASKVLVPRSLRAEVYEEIRNVLPYNYLDSLDADHPLVCDFYVPSETVRIISVKLSAKGLPFRSYTRGASGGEKHTHTVTLAPHNHPITLQEINLNTGRATTGLTVDLAGKHAHTKVTKTPITLTHSSEGEPGTSTAPGHSHSFVGSDSETISVSNHSHVYGTEGDWTQANGGFSKTISTNISGQTGTAGSHKHTMDGHPSEQVNVTSEDRGEHVHGVKEPSVENPDGTREYGHDHPLPGIPVAATATELSQQTIATTEADEGHAHEPIPGIYEDSPPADVMLRLDNGSGFALPTTRYYCGCPGVTRIAAIDNAVPLGNPATDGVLVSELNLTSFFTGTGWKRIMFESSTLGRINAQLIVKVDITA